VDLTSFGLTYGRLFQALAGLVLMETIHWAMSRRDWTHGFKRRGLRWAVYYAVIVMVMLSARGTTSFIYAKF